MQKMINRFYNWTASRSNKYYEILMCIAICVTLLDGLTTATALLVFSSNFIEAMGVPRCTMESYGVIPGLLLIIVQKLAIIILACKSTLGKFLAFICCWAVIISTGCAVISNTVQLAMHVYLNL